MHAPAAKLNAADPPAALLLELCGVLYDDSCWRRWMLQLLTRMGLQTHYAAFFQVWEQEHFNRVCAGEVGYWEAMRSLLRSVGLPPGRVDRSPCGTGSNANMAVRYLDGRVKPGDAVISRSTFSGNTGLAGWDHQPDSFFFGNVTASQQDYEGKGWGEDEEEDHLQRRELIRLNQVVQVPALSADGASPSAHDSQSHRRATLECQRIAKSHHPVADTGRLVGECDELELFLGVQDLQQRRSSRSHRDWSVLSSRRTRSPWPMPRPGRAGSRWLRSRRSRGIRKPIRPIRRMISSRNLRPMST